MKILVFSDTHLGSSFDEKKFHFLKNLIEKADKVIINGDLWEGYSMSFERFVNSPWKHLFPLLKRKKTIYLFGNHDKKLQSDERVSLFSDTQSNKYVYKPNGIAFVIEHGNRLWNAGDEGKKRDKVVESTTIAVDLIEHIITRKLGKKMTKFLLQRFNNIIKKKATAELQKNEVFICGHTHLAEYDKKNRFINTGIIRHGLAQYMIIEDGKIKIHEEWYK